MPANTPSDSPTRRRVRPRRGFSITELLVVIGIIVLLVGILLVAVGDVRGKALETATEGTMNAFAAACETYHLEHETYPGIVPESFLDNDSKMSGTENAILALMGTYVREADDPLGYPTVTGAGWEELVISGRNSDFRVKVNTAGIGKGPVIEDKPYAPYYTPKGSELGATSGEQVGEAVRSNGSAIRLPELLDAWGQPIVYVRRARTRGPLTGPANSNPQFLLRSMAPYIKSTSLGELGKDQMALSCFNVGSADDQFTTFAQVLEHPSLPGQPLGAFMLLSAGRDGVYFSVEDGPGEGANPITSGNIATNLHGQGPRIIDEFDDIRVFGGGG